MGLNRDAFASIDTKERELAGQMPGAVKGIMALAAAKGLGGSTVIEWRVVCERQLKLLADHISDRRKWVKETSSIPPLIWKKSWRLRVDRAMRALKVACLASLDEVVRVLPNVRNEAERQLDAAFVVIAEKLEHKLTAIDAEARSPAKKAGAALVVRYAPLAVAYLLGAFSSHYWPKLVAVVRLLKGR